MKSPCSKLRGITSPQVNFAEKEECYRIRFHPALQAAGNSKLKKWKGYPKN
jgi:hypothetical protein